MDAIALSAVYRDKYKLLQLPILLFLVITIGSLNIGHSSPAPTQNLTCEPGGCMTPSGSCTDNIWLDGTTPIDTRTKASQVVGTVGQDIGAFLNTQETAGTMFCLGPYTFTLTTRFSVTKNNVGLTGAGQGLTILRGSGVTDSIVNINSNAGTTITGFYMAHLTLDANSFSGTYSTFSTFDLVGSPGSFSAANTYPADKVTIEDVGFLNAKSSQSNSVNVYLRFSTITSSLFQTAQSSLIFCVACQNTTITNSIFRDWVGGAAITVTPGSTPDTKPIGVVINGVTLDNHVNSGQGLGIEVSNSWYTTITGCTVMGTQVAIQFDNVASEAATKGMVVSGCIMKDSSGINLAGNGQTGSTFQGASLTGNVVAGGKYCIQLTGFTGTTITGNTCTGQTGFTINGNVVSGIVISTNGAGNSAFYTNQTLISDNVITGGTSGVAIRAETLGASANYLINFLTITNNDLRGNAGTIAFSGIGKVTNSTIKNNFGVNPIGKASFPFCTATTLIAPQAIPGYPCSSGFVASPATSTTYTVFTTDCIISASGGSGLSITVTDGGGNNVFTAAQTSLQGFYLPIGYKINFGAFSGGPTFIVSSN